MELLEDRGYDVEDQKFTYKAFVERFVGHLPDDLVEDDEEMEGEGDDTEKKLDVLRKAHRYMPIVREQLFFFTQKRDNSEQRIFLFFLNDYRLRIPDIKKYYNNLLKEKCKNCIIVLKGRPESEAGGAVTSSGQAKKAIAALYEKGYHFEVFKEQELRYNVTKHVLVPTHIPLTEREKKQLLQCYKFTAEQIPRMYLTDPVARYYGMQRGDVFKIVRPSETAGRYVTYRRVV